MAPVPRYLIIKESIEMDRSSLPPVASEALNIDVKEIYDFEAKNGRPGVALDDSQFYFINSQGNKVKLGLGLSAAEAVGVIALRFERAAMLWQDNRYKIFQYAHQAHNQAQEGLGSGADVAACAYASPIKFRREEDKVHIEPITGDIMKYEIPLQLVWTGIPANTRDKVAAFERWVETENNHLLRGFIATADQLANAWFQLPMADLFEKIDNFNSRLREISEAAKLSLILPIHEEFDGWARRNGGRSKPTGAGGGDMILMIGDLPTGNLKRTLIPLVL